MSKSIFISGSNRGLGLAFCESFLSLGYHVFAGSRDPSKNPTLLQLKEKHRDSLSLIELDVTSAESVTRALKSVEREVAKLDILLNNAGRYGEPDSGNIENVSDADVLLTFETNTLGPMRVTRAFYPLLKLGKERKVVHITSLMGSVSDNSSGGSYGYRISKAALNMLNKNLSIELRPHHILSVALHPGWVRTDMGGKNAPLEISESVPKMVTLIQGLTMADSGKFLKYDGSPCPY